MLGGLSQLWLTLESTFFNQLPPIVKLGGEMCSGGINILAIDIPTDGRLGNVNPLVVDSDVIQTSMFGGAAPCLAEIEDLPHRRHRNFGPYPHYSGPHHEPSSPVNAW